MEKVYPIRESHLAYLLKIAKEEARDKSLKAPAFQRKFLNDMVVELARLIPKSLLKTIN